MIILAEFLGLEPYPSLLNSRPHENANPDIASAHRIFNANPLTPASPAGNYSPAKGVRCAGHVYFMPHTPQVT
jgi:hypothetical protein